MSPENRDEMLPEYDMRGGERGKFFAHAQRFAGITTAVGPLDLSVLTSTGDESAPQLLLVASKHPTHISPQVRTEWVERIAPEVSATPAHAG